MEDRRDDDAVAKERAPAAEVGRGANPGGTAAAMPPESPGCGYFGWGMTRM